MDDYIIKFLLKNKENINKLNKFIDKNKSNIRRIITSPELFCWLQKLDGYEPCTLEDKIKYNDVLVISDILYPPKTLSFIMKNDGNDIEFNLPCMCGIYDDEPHP